MHGILIHLICSSFDKWDSKSYSLNLITSNAFWQVPILKKTSYRMKWLQITDSELHEILFLPLEWWRYLVWINIRTIHSNVLRNVSKKSKTTLLTLTIPGGFHCKPVVLKRIFVQQFGLLWLLYWSGSWGVCRFLHQI